MDRHGHTSLELGTLEAGVSLERLPRSDERRDVQSVSDGRVEDGLCALSRDARLTANQEADAGFVICHTCHGSPNQYELDCDEVCPECNGDGVVADPDYVDGGAECFDPRSAYGTHHRIYARGR